MSDDVAFSPWPFHPYPWQKEVWQQLCDLHESSRLPHALLISGDAGIGKERLAQAFMARLLCQSPAHGMACGKCRACTLLNGRVHADHQWVTLELDDKGKLRTQISVSQIRDLIAFAGKASQMGGWRVIAIHPAHKLNVNSANALLKTLEEPGERTLLMLVTDRPLSLPATIRSRCQQLALAVPAEEEALAWLNQEVRDEDKSRLLLSVANGAPLAAQALQSSVWFGERERLLRSLKDICDGRQTALAASSYWNKLGAAEVFTALNSLVRDVAVVASGATVVKHQDLMPIISALAKQVSAAAALAFCRELAEKQRLLQGNVAGNSLLDEASREWGLLRNR